MKYHVYPAIGIGRVGNSDEVFVGPEVPGSLGSELAGGEVTAFKDAQARMRRQAARFRLFEQDDLGGPLRPASLPAGAVVHWIVDVANLKDAVDRPDDPEVEGAGAGPRPQRLASRKDRAIVASGEVSAAAPTIRLSGTYLTATVPLAELRLQPDGMLLVVPGKGDSQSPENAPIGSELGGGGYYNNRGWFDDVCDGRVRAEIRVPGAAPQAATSAWVVTAPPDFAPGIEGVVTLYDVLFQTACERGEVAPPTPPSFSRDVWPMLRRASDLRWVDHRDGNNPWKDHSRDWATLSKTSVSLRQVRAAEAKRLRDIGPKGQLENFALRPWQEEVLTQWVEGTFVDDFDGTLPDAGVLSPDVLTRVTLDAGVGQGFFPGIEAGIVVKDPTLFAAPFRIADDVEPGTLTALMALPWQADFLKCSNKWWPAQRPDDAPQEPDGATWKRWIRPITPGGHRDLVDRFGKLGVVVPRKVGSTEVRVEVGRDPTL